MEYISEAQAGLNEATRAENAAAGMSGQDRAELARSLADYSKSDYKKSGTGGGTRRGSAPGNRVIGAPESEAVRLAADLHRTERRIEARVPGPTLGREIRLSSRAGRLKRKLRRLAA